MKSENEIKMTNFLMTIFIFLIVTCEAIDYINITIKNTLVNFKHELKEHERQQRSVFSTSNPLYCPPCEQIHCYKRNKRRLKCKGGYTVGICGCCRVCAKLENEQCGGAHNYLGNCDKGLACEPEPPVEVTFMTDKETHVVTVHKGICKKALAVTTATPLQCRPKCDPDFCNKNPRAICSALDNAENTKNCQGKCLHTSCRACRFLEPEEQCAVCNLDDFKCIRDFGRCMRKKMCKPKHYPCGVKKAVGKNLGQFMCAIPECS